VIARLALATTLASLVVVPLARADADPASDYLLGQSTFVPSEVPSDAAKPLTTVIEQAKSGGYTIRVALIATEYDLGGVSVLYRQPKRYARFLGTELTLVYHGRLLVVMPNGLAISRNGKLVAQEQAVLDRIPAPGTDGTAIANTATRAVVRLATASGVHVVQPPPVAATKNDTNRERVIIAAAALAAVALALAYGFIRRRRARD
jgi:hypothetical protein